MGRLQKALDHLKAKNRYRSLRLPGGVDLSSNDYLGLMNHPVLKEVAISAIESGVGLGSGGSRLLRGHHQAHQDLEEFAAAYYGAEKALYFANGFQANYALFSALPSRHDVVLYDSLIHACVKDGLRGSFAKGVSVPHNDLDAFEDACKRFRDKAGTLWIAVESVYSMDGDRAPLRELYGLAVRHGAILVVDEAHGTGVWGAHGKGESAALPQENLITVHTCGKALGVAGGLVCGSSEIIETLINSARAFIYSTAPPPLQAFLTQKAMELSASDEGAARREKLHALCKMGEDLFGGPGTQIIPVVLGEDGRAVRASEILREAGYDIRAIRPPTVPEGQARLRISLNAHLTEDVLETVAGILKELDLLKAA